MHTPFFSIEEGQKNSDPKSNFMLETNGNFCLGRATVNNTPILYNPADLITHAVILGMNGSGKTGLNIELPEVTL